MNTNRGDQVAKQRNYLPHLCSKTTAGVYAINFCYLVKIYTHAKGPVCFHFVIVHVCCVCVPFATLPSSKNVMLSLLFVFNHMPQIYVVLEPIPLNNSLSNKTSKNNLFISGRLNHIERDCDYRLDLGEGEAYLRGRR